MNIFLGYALTIAWVFGMIFVAGGPIAKRTNIETSRKIIHTSLFMVWVFIDLFLKGTVHQVLLPVLFTVLNALSYKFKFYSSVERAEDNHPGTIYFAIAVTVIMFAAYVNPEHYIHTGVACFCLTFGDGFAALIGYNVKSPKIRGNKSYAGFAACFAASFVALIAFKLIYMKEMAITAALLIAAVAAVTELTGKGLDNFTVTFSVMLASMMLRHEGADIALLWGLLFMALVFFTKAMSYFGALLALVMVSAFRFYGGAAGFGFLTGCYLIIFIAGIIKALAKGKRKHEGRGFLQVLINGGLGTALIIAYGLTGADWCLITALVSIGGNFIDSVSSDVGCIARKQPYDFFKKQYVATGLSGGMSALGTGAAFVCSALIGVYMGIVMEMSIGVCVAAGVLAFAQSLLDTCLGSLVQRKNRCLVCGEITESINHCGERTRLESGVWWIDNNTVNLISSCVITALCALIMAAI